MGPVLAATQRVKQETVRRILHQRPGQQACDDLSRVEGGEVQRQEDKQREGEEVEVIRDG